MFFFTVGIKVLTIISETKRKYCLLLQTEQLNSATLINDLFDMNCVYNEMKSFLKGILTEKEERGVN